MSALKNDFSKLGFLKTFVVPALLVFLIPLIGLAFFYHAQSVFNASARESVLQQIRSDGNLSPEEREKAIEVFSRVPFSRMLLDEEFAKQVDSTVRFNYATFRWMIILSALAIGSGILVFVVAGICVAVSVQSQLAQYLFLSLGWQILRIYAAIQIIITGILLVALSYWITALWFHQYWPQLIFIAGFLAIAGTYVAIAAIFRRVQNDFHIEGVVLNRGDSSIWNQIKAICDRVGADIPNQIIAGIDDNFFVTETPVIINGKTITGKSLFVSLPLLKQLNATEADAVLAHEMAHFSGKDTMYSKRIAPLLIRYGMYLQALAGQPAAKPVFYFMNFFRALFELSLGKINREREFRADRIAAEMTSPRDFAGALLRIGAFSKYRYSVELELFQNERKLDTADISRKIDLGFHDYAVMFSQNPEMGREETAHPFDSHPPNSQRLSALGIELNPELAAEFLGRPGDGGWYRTIPDSDAVTRQLWQAYEERFRESHLASLPYRYLPETDEERAIVLAAFPIRRFEHKNLVLTLDYDKLLLSSWPDPITYQEISGCNLNENNVLTVVSRQDGRDRRINIAQFQKGDRAAILAEFQRYYGRYLAAVEYQKHLKASGVAGTPSPSASEAVAAT